MIDLTGIVEHIDRQQSYEVVTDLMVGRLKSMIAEILPSDQHKLAFLNDEGSCKVFMQFALAFLTDINRKLYFCTHIPVPILLH